MLFSVALWTGTNIKYLFGVPHLGVFHTAFLVRSIQSWLTTLLINVWLSCLEDNFFLFFSLFHIRHFLLLPTSPQQVEVLNVLRPWSTFINCKHSRAQWSCVLRWNGPWVNHSFDFSWLQLSGERQASWGHDGALCQFCIKQTHLLNHHVERVIYIYVINFSKNPLS